MRCSTERDAWRKQAQRLALPKPETASTLVVVARFDWVILCFTRH